MAFRSFIRAALSRALFGLVIILLLTNPAHSVDSQDSQIFISGFNAYQKKDYRGAIDRMSEVLQKYPDTPLRDMAIFWLARANFKAGNQQDAARYMAQFFKEYPDSPLKSTVEDELVTLTKRYEKGEQLQVATAMPAVDQTAAERARQAAADKEREKVAAEKAEKEKLAREKAEQERLAKEQAAKEQVAAEQARMAKEREAAVKAEADKAAVAKAEQERLALEKAEAERLAAAKDEQERLAKELAAAEQARLAKEQETAARAEADRVAKVRAEQEQLTRKKLEADRLAAEQAEQERVAREKAAVDQLAAEQARLTQEREAAAKLEAERLVAARAEEERLARQQAAAESAVPKAAAAASQPAPVIVAEASPTVVKKSVPARKKGEQRKAVRTNPLRDKAIAEYKTVIDRFPGTTAATRAQAKLKGMGIVYPERAVAGDGNVQVLNLEIAQFAALDFSVALPESGCEVGKRVAIPFEIVNRGNGEDSFYLEAGFPAEFNAQLAAAANPAVPLNMTSALPPGGTFKGVVNLTIPQGDIDGRKNSYPVKVASLFAREVSQSRQIPVVSAAPFLRAVIKADKVQILPGEQVSYRIALLNIGTAKARSVSFRLNYPPQYEPVAPVPAGFRQEMKAALVLDGLQLGSGESKEYTVSFQLRDDAVARQELLLRGDLVNSELATRDSFLSTAAYVQGVSGLAVRTPVERLVVIPGQTVALPLILTNTGNIREGVTIRPTVPSGLGMAIYQDLNRDGIRQTNEPAITNADPLSPREESYLLLEVKTPATATDGSESLLTLQLEPENARSKGVTANLKLVFSRPVVDLAMASQGGRFKPGEVASFDLTCTNRGTNMAKVVEIQSQLPANLELVAAEPSFLRGSNGIYIWRFAELGAGEKKNVKVTFRIKEGITVGTTISVRNQISYEDQLGNRY